MEAIANVHRLGDKVAVYVGDGSTTYLTVKQARALAHALRTCAKSVVNEKFTDSAFGTVEVKEVTNAQYVAELRRFPRNKEKAK